MLAFTSVTRVTKTATVDRPEIEGLSASRQRAPRRGVTPGPPQPAVPTRARPAPSPFGQPKEKTVNMGSRTTVIGAAAALMAGFLVATGVPAAQAATVDTNAW